MHIFDGPISSLLPGISWLFCVRFRICDHTDRAFCFPYTIQVQLSLLLSRRTQTIPVSQYKFLHYSVCIYFTFSSDVPFKYPFGDLSFEHDEFIFIRFCFRSPCFICTLSVSEKLPNYIKYKHRFKNIQIYSHQSFS